MSESIRASTRSQDGLTDEDIRRRLEGRAEVLDAARARYAALESVLGARRWKRELRARPELVPEWLRHEPAVTEALERATRRARVEGWPEGTPVLVAARELLACRRRLESLTARRLGRSGAVSGGPPLELDLPRLDAWARRKVSPDLAPGEVLLFEGRQERWVFLSLLKAGRVRLTNKRLVWHPVLGEPVEVPLSSIHPGGVQVEAATSTLRVQGDVGAELPHVENVYPLATLLDLHTRPPLRGVWAGGRPVDALIYPVELRKGSVRLRRGLAVLRPHGVSFIPVGTVGKAFHAITGSTPKWPVELEQVLESLLGLEDTEFDAWVARVVEATDGERWSDDDVSFWPDTPLGEELRSLRGQLARSGPPKSVPSPGATERVLCSWPRTPSANRQWW